ncbi:hypothetical protein NIES4102_13230 [Chondrocystis sp. NIES-4102]|nr:hypothetical protein NIES4102_13230 [Chondrocystis sp. NIES-4102]
MKKALFLSIATVFLLSPSTVFGQSSPSPNDRVPSPGDNQQQQAGTEINRDELEALLSVGCSNTSNQNKKTIAQSISSQVDGSLPAERLAEFTETVLEIKKLPTDQRLELCQN